MERGRRPIDYKNVDEEPLQQEHCPYCQGWEESGYRKIADYRDFSVTDSHDWHVRVLTLPGAVLSKGNKLNRKGWGIYDLMDGVGEHEVIIESKTHVREITELEQEQLERIVWVCRERLERVLSLSHIVYGLVFKNRGLGSGASCEHAHSSIVAMPIIPKRMLEELEGAKRYFRYKERCVYCDIIRQEVRDRVRVVTENNHFIAICPYASRFPFEVWIFPKHHEVRFENVSREQCKDCADILYNVIRKINKALGNPSYNYVIHTPPVGDDNNLTYHWHIEIIPRITKVAGFEWGSGIYINIVSPEEAARYLRGV